MDKVLDAIHRNPDDYFQVSILMLVDSFVRAYENHTFALIVRGVRITRQSCGIFLRLVLFHQRKATP